MLHAEVLGQRLPGPVADPDVVAGTVVLAGTVGSHDHLDVVVVTADFTAVDHDPLGDRIAVAGDRQLQTATLRLVDAIGRDAARLGVALSEEGTNPLLVLGLGPGSLECGTMPAKQCHRRIVGHERGDVTCHRVADFERTLVVGDDLLHAVRQVFLEQLLQVGLLRDHVTSREPLAMHGEGSPEARADDDVGKFAEHEVHAELVRFTLLNRLPGDEVDERPLEILLQMVLHRHDDVVAVPSPESLVVELGEERRGVLDGELAGVRVAEDVNQRLPHLVGDGAAGGHTGDEQAGLGFVGHGEESLSSLSMNVALQQLDRFLRRD